MGNILIEITLFLVLIIISYKDIQSKRVPNKCIILITILSFIYESQIAYGQRLMEALIIVLPFVIIWLIRVTGLGAGDIKLIFVCSLLLGVEQMLWGLLFGMITIIVTRFKYYKKKEIPLIPYISLGIFLSVLLM